MRPKIGNDPCSDSLMDLKWYPYSDQNVQFDIITMNLICSLSSRKTVKDCSCLERVYKDLGRFAPSLSWDSIWKIFQGSQLKFHFFRGSKRTHGMCASVEWVVVIVGFNYRDTSGKLTWKCHQVICHIVLVLNWENDLIMSTFGPFGLFLKFLKLI